MFQVSSAQERDAQEELILSLLAASIPALLPPNGVWVCKRIEVGEQLEPFALLLRLAHLLVLLEMVMVMVMVIAHLLVLLDNPSHSCLLAECKEVAWEEALVGQ